MPALRLSITSSERIYCALLSLYPARFRLRFEPELRQLFRDCYCDALKAGRASTIAAFWMRAARDLLISALRERGREFAAPLAAEHPLMRALDLVLVPSMITANLLALGPILTLLVASGATIPYSRFAATSALFSFIVGALAIAASVLMTRLRPTVRLWVKLSAL